MPGSLTTPSDLSARVDAPGPVAFRSTHSVGFSGTISFVAQWLAYALPCRRFAPALADGNARLGAVVDRYSFIVVDLHHLLLAGLPAHAQRNDAMCHGRLPDFADGGSIAALAICCFGSVSTMACRRT